MTIEAKETDLSPAAVPEYEIWNIEEFRDYRVRLINNGGKAVIEDFEEWKVRKGVAKEIKMCLWLGGTAKAQKGMKQTV